MTTRTFSNQVRSQLRAGLGVEDIAIDLQCPVEDVRAVVKALRRKGVLDLIYGGRMT